MGAIALTSMNAPKVAPTIATLKLTANALILLDLTPVTVLQDSKKETMIHALTSMNALKVASTLATLKLTANVLILLDPTPVTVIQDSKKEKVKKKAIALTSMNVLTKRILV